MATTLVLVPGSFGKSELYDPVVLPLREKGYDIHVLDPPCFPKGYKKGTPAPSMQEDAKFITEYVNGLADKNGNDIVIMAHSYGGLPTTEALGNITAVKRAAEGKKGGVIRAAYLTAIVPKVGENLMATIQGGAPSMGVDEDGWLFHSDPSATAAIAFSDLPLEVGTKHVVENFGKHSSVAFGDPLTNPGYKDVPVSWFFCARDNCVSPEVQQTAIDNIEAGWKGTKRDGEKVDVTRVECDHVPIFSARDDLEKWMEGLFGKA